MLHVLFILLKILGILLLLLVGVLLLVLLAPLRYSFKLEKEEQVSPEFSVRVTWLCWLFYFKASYIEKVFDYRMRILVIRLPEIKRNFLKSKRKRQKKRRKNVEKKKRTGRRNHRKKKRNCLLQYRKRKSL